MRRQIAFILLTIAILSYLTPVGYADTASQGIDHIYMPVTYDPSASDGKSMTYVTGTPYQRTFNYTNFPWVYMEVMGDAINPPSYNINCRFKAGSSNASSSAWVSYYPGTYKKFTLYSNYTAVGTMLALSVRANTNEDYGTYDDCFFVSAVYDLGR